MVTTRNSLSNEIQLLAGFAPKPTAFSIDAIQSTAYLLLDTHKKAAKQICAALKPVQLNMDGLKRCFHDFFGTLDQNHGIYPGHRLGFDATEPQITKGISSFIDPVMHGKDRLHAFLLAILEGRSKNESLIASLQSGIPCKFIIEAEKLVPKSNRRIDLFIAWNPLGSNKYEFGLLIEAKFGHKVTAGQLPTYKQHARELISNTNNSALVLLTLDGNPSSKNKDWQPVKWFTLMSRWERKLKDTDIDFINFRKFIWKKLGC